MKVAVLWTGGKDSSLACHKAMKEGYEVTFFVTFIWNNPSQAHSLPLIKMQSDAVKIPFLWDKLEEPYFEAYREAILELKEEYGIEGIVTGDISYVDAFHGNWIDDVCKGTGVKVIKPLWDLDRTTIMKDLLDDGFKSVFTCVKEPWMDEKWLGKTIDENSILEIESLSSKTGMDLCGEFGEYHTMTLDAPFFKKKIAISQFKSYKQGESFLLEPLELSSSTKWQNWR